MAVNPVAQLKASIEAQKTQREAAVATSLEISNRLDKDPKNARTEPQQTRP